MLRGLSSWVLDLFQLTILTTTLCIFKSLHATDSLEVGWGQVGGWEKREQSRKTGMTYKHSVSGVMPGPSGAFITLFGTGEHSKNATVRFSNFTTLAPHALSSLWSQQKTIACLSKGPWTNCMPGERSQDSYDFRDPYRGDLPSVLVFNPAVDPTTCHAAVWVASCFPGAEAG